MLWICSIGARSVVTTRLSFGVGLDALKISMNFIIIIMYVCKWDAGANQAEGGTSNDP
jgi:hypothetical protein